MGRVETKITVSEQTRNDAREAKRDGETWDHFLKRCTDTPPRLEVLVPADVIRECDPEDVEQWREAVRAEVRG